MRVKNLVAVFSHAFLAAALSFNAHETARAQEAAGATQKTAAPEKFDEYGDLRHCDLTARLDNFAVTLQNTPTATGFVVSFDPLAKKYDYAGRHLKVARHYLVNSRGIDSARVVVVDGGSKHPTEGSTELWVVPQGAEPPVAPPAEDKFADANFSGKFDTYATDEREYRYLPEMGFSAVEIGYWEFADKLKRQPDSIGYLVVRESKDGVPGAWKRIARRDEQILRKHYGVEAARLKSINGGPSGEGRSEVEFWVLPKSAPPPPAAVAEEGGREPKAAVMLNRLDSYGGLDKDAEEWVLENLAEILRENPRASACLVARPQAESEVEVVSEGDGGAEVQDEEAAEETTVEDASGGVDAGDTAEGEGDTAEGEDERIAGTSEEFAERWKEILLTKYGIEARRVVVLKGRPMAWSVERLTTWLVPERAALPDPLARDDDDPEEEEEVVAEEAGNDEAVEHAVEAEQPATHPPFLVPDFSELPPRPR